MKIAEQSLPKSIPTIQVYTRRVDLLRDHAGSAFL
jgi:hypothetical protein